MTLGQPTANTFLRPDAANAAAGAIGNLGGLTEAEIDAAIVAALSTIDLSDYLTTSAAASTYFPLSGGTLTGPITGTSNILEQRNSTNAQRLRVSKTWTSSTSFEQFEIDATDASNFDLVALRGSAGGSARGIRIGGKQDGGSFVPWLSFDTAGVATFGGNLAVPTNNIISAGTFNITGSSTGSISRGFAFYFGNIAGYVASTRIFEMSSAAVQVNGNFTLSPSTSRTLSTNGQLTIERTSDTAINLVYRGNDGTTRRLALTGFA